MFSPDSFMLELNTTPVPVLDATAEAQHNFPTPEPAWLSPDSTQTMWVDLDPGTLITGGKDDKGSSTVGVGTTSTSPSAEGGAEEEEMWQPLQRLMQIS